MTALSLLPESAMAALYGGRRAAAAPPAAAAPAASPGLSSLRSRWASEHAVNDPAAAPAAAAGPRGLRSLVPPTAYAPAEQAPLGEVMRNAGRKALGGGIPGAAAMSLQVLTLMWMRSE
jgi:hypothetical protein